MDQFEYVDTIQMNGEVRIKVKGKAQFKSLLDFFVMEDKASDPYKPYPVSDGYANITDIMSGRQKVVQDDWMQGCIEIARYAKKFYENKDKKHYYDSESSINGDTYKFKEVKQKEGEKGVKRLRKLWGYKDGETIEEKCKRVDREHREKQLKFFTDFLIKFDK